MAAALNQMYNPVWQLFDNNGRPLTNGAIFFFENDDHNEPKDVYINSTGVTAWPNPIILNAAGFQPENYGIFGSGSYYVEFRKTLDRTSELIFSQENLIPPQIAGSTPVVTEVDIENYIINGQLYFDYGQDFLSAGQTVHGFEFIPAAALPIAQDNWLFVKNNTTATDQLLITDFIPGETNPTNNPKAYFNYVCTVPGTGETFKQIQYAFNSVRMFSGETINLQFSANALFPLPITIEIGQVFGDGGSTSVFTSIQTINLTTSWVDYSMVIDVPTISGKTIGNSGDAFFLQFNFPLNAVSNINLANFCLRIGSTIVPFQEESVNITEAQAIALEGAISTSVNSADGNFYPVLLQGQSNWTYNTLAGTIVDKGYAYRNGWDGLECNGALINSSSYYNLANAISTNFGIGPAGFYAYSSNSVIFTTDATGVSLAAAHDVNTHMYVYTVTPGAVGVNQIIEVLCSPGSEIPNSSYFFISNTTTTFYYWFNLNGTGIDPTPGGTGKMVAYTGTETAAEIASLIYAVLSAGITISIPSTTLTAINVTNGAVASIAAGTSTLTVNQGDSGSGSVQANANITLVAGSDIINGSYLTINAVGQGYYLWFSLGNTTQDPGQLPALAGLKGIKVIYTGIETDVEMVALVAQQLINVQVRIPGTNGLFIRQVANGSTNDPDRNSRTAIASGGNTGDNVGSFQEDIFENHLHNIPVFGSVGAGPLVQTANAMDDANNVNTDATGGAETRPVNAYFDKVILI